MGPRTMGLFSLELGNVDDSLHIIAYSKTRGRDERLALLGWKGLEDGAIVVCANGGASEIGKDR